MGSVQFLQPMAIVLSIFLPLLIILYILKLRRPPQEVSSTYLWKRILQDERVNTFWQKLRRQFLLFIQLIILLFLILAALRPWRKSEEILSKKILIIMDVSASMMTQENNRETRMDQAKGEAYKILSRVPDNGEVALIAFHQVPWFVQSFTRNLREVRKKIESLSWGPYPTNYLPLFKLLEGLGQLRLDTQIHLISDGAIEESELKDLQTNLDIVFHQVGSRKDNVQISACRIQRKLDQPREVEIFLSLTNESASSTEGELTFFINEQVIEKKVLSLAPQLPQDYYFSFEWDKEGILKIQWEGGDPFPLDNQFIYPLYPPRFLRVGWIGDPSSSFIEKVIQAFPFLQLVPIQPNEVKDIHNMDVLIIDTSTSLSSIPLVPFLSFGGSIPDYPILLGDKMATPEITNWMRTHPINRFIDYSTLKLQESHGLILQFTAQSLVESYKVPIIGCYEYPRTRMRGIICGFNLSQTSWPYYVDFPIFIKNSLSFLLQNHIRYNPCIFPGTTLFFPSYPGEEFLRIMTPTSQEKRIKPKKGLIEISSFLYELNCFEELGLYKIDRQPFCDTTYIAVNFVGGGIIERITPQTPTFSGPPRVRFHPPTIEKQVEYTPYILCLVLLLLLFEWLVFHYRLVE